MICHGTAPLKGWTAARRLTDLHPVIVQSGGVNGMALRRTTGTVVPYGTVGCHCDVAAEMSLGVSKGMSLGCHWGCQGLMSLGVSQGCEWMSLGWCH